jgi:hypothetical protein
VSAEPSKHLFFSPPVNILIKTLSFLSELYLAQANCYWGQVLYKRIQLINKIMTNYQWLLKLLGDHKMGTASEESHALHTEVEPGTAASE